MANCSNSSLLQTDSGILDVNQNLSNSENSFFSDTVPESIIISDGNIHFAEDATVCKPLISESHNFIEISDNLPDTLLKSDEVTYNSNDIDNNKESDSGVLDSDNNIVENAKLIDFTNVGLNLSNGTGVIIPDFNSQENCKELKDEVFGTGVMISDFNSQENNCMELKDEVFGTGVMISDFSSQENCIELKDEEFHDAVQFFKDPSSLTFLENAGTSTASTESLITRSSLYMNFDPLHAKFFSQSNKSNDLQDIVECETEPEVPLENAKNGSVPKVVNEHLSNVSPRESLGNILISFDSPVIGKNDNVKMSEKDQPNEPPKLYTEEELQQALKIQELSVQETFLKRQHDHELERTQKQREMEEKFQKQKLLSSALYSVLKEVIETIHSLSDKKRILAEKLEEAEKENNKLKEDLKTSDEDLQSVECTFSDFHRRYEQCKSMLKVYTQNEDNLKLQLEDLRVQLHEKEEMIDKANIEVSNAKKAGDAQVAILKAQLKKAELKISSLENDVKHVKIENDKLSSLCDELMAKVGESLN